MKQIKYLILVITVCLTANLYAQSVQKDTVSIAFWNLENLFDTVHSPGKRDIEFTPEGRKDWTKERLEHKLRNQARVISSMNNGKGPDILGFCEVEHEKLIKQLISKFSTKVNYKIAYAESPDNRGIDNGLIYNTRLFSLLSVIPDTIHLSDNYPTRFVLNVNLLDVNKDTLHFFINHWPSRIGGTEKSEPNRITAAKVLKKAVDNYVSKNRNSQIIIMGDFNDEPGNNSILKTLDAQPFICSKKMEASTELKSEELLNLAYSTYNNGGGTYKYRDDWNMLDQVIVSAPIVKNSNLHYLCNSFKIYKPSFMVTHSGKYKGTAFPTYGGRRYLGGYSDHFPVISKFILKVRK